ncbi:MAG: LysR substrate-binding domain-containing protein [Gammaproteobacteria bacterium]|nr:LysR substrate-binding domain-containing protein [Gammaproteobacteria bacterium]
MSYKLPSLKGLRAVEAVSRQGSLAGAARELNVTTGAVSRQVMVIEEYYGRKLFERKKGRMVLTEVGRQCAGSLTEAFKLIEIASMKAERQEERRKLTIRGLGTFTAEWLLPNLPEFEALYPSLEIQVKGQRKPVNFDMDDADVGLIIGRGRWRGLESEYLYTPRITAIANPDLLRDKPIGIPSDLNSARILHPMDLHISWQQWLQVVQPGFHLESPKNCWLETSSQMFNAVRLGVGVGLGQYLLVGYELVRGTLVAPIKSVARVSHSMYLVWPRKVESNVPEVRDLRDWMIAKIGDLEHALEPLLAEMREVQFGAR